MLPDLPLHGDSEDRPRHPYSPDWMAEVLAGFCREVVRAAPLVGGHDVGALILLRAVQTRQLTPGRLVLMPSALHRRPMRHRLERIVLGAARAGAVPGSTARSRTRAAGVPPQGGRGLTGARQPGGARPRAPRLRRRRRRRHARPRVGPRGAALADRSAVRTCSTPTA